jgi:thiamine biosynthesis lipoprotein
MAPWSVVVFRAMASPCRIVAPTRELAEHGQQLVQQLERAWSRFDPASEVSAVNEAAGNLTIVSAVTFELMSLAQQARIASCGAFNPLMLDQLVALGYDRTWDELGDDERTLPEFQPAVEAPIELFPEISGVCLPPGARFDPGGIGKGLAGDMVAAALLAGGAESVQIELGGDVRVAGPEWAGGSWRVMLDDNDHGAANPATITLPEGGVATSSIIRRRWRRAGVQVHHLIDPQTGLSASTDLDAVTVAAPTLWWAEVMAKIALIGGARQARAVLGEYDMTAVLVGRNPDRRYELLSPRTLAG